MAKFCHGDRERLLWIENDPVLNYYFQKSGLTADEYVNAHRKEIDDHMQKVLNHGEAK